MSSVLFIVDCDLQSSYLEGGVGDMDFHMQQCHNVYMYTVCGSVSLNINILVWVHCVPCIHVLTCMVVHVPPKLFRLNTS